MAPVVAGLAGLRVSAALTLREGALLLFPGSEQQEQMLHPIIFAVVVAVEVATMSEVLVDSRAAVAVAVAALALVV